MFFKCAYLQVESSKSFELFDNVNGEIKLNANYENEESLYEFYISSLVFISISSLSLSNCNIKILFEYKYIHIIIFKTVT